MTWRYQATCKTYGDEKIFEVREVYSGIHLSWTENAIAPISTEGKEGLIKVLEMMLSDVKEFDVLEVDGFQEIEETFVSTPLGDEIDRLKLYLEEIEALEDENKRLISAAVRASAFILPTGYDEDLALKMMTNAETFGFAFVADREYRRAEHAEAEIERMRAGAVSHETLIATECERDEAEDRLEKTQLLYEQAEAELAVALVMVKQRDEQMSDVVTELAALKARSCETCASCDTCAVQNAAWVKFGAFEAEVGFYCSEWTARP